MRILFMANHRPNRSPGQRFRFEQYLEYLKQHGIDCEFSWLLDETDDQLFYNPGHVLQKASIAARAFLKRARETSRWLYKSYDVIFVFREAFFLLGPLFEHRAQARGAKLVFDFDDAIWIPAISKANQRFAWLKSFEKTDKILSKADMVFAGNEYLASYARSFNSNVHVIPTTIDTKEYMVHHQEKAHELDPICIGWSGSFSTIVHFEQAIPVLKRIKKHFQNKVSFKVIGDADYRCSELGIVGDAWRKNTELDDLRKIDIGIMPLPDDEWSRGKCGLKGLQYMALGIPTLMSPVGVNSEIIQNEINGFLPRNEDEWFARLSQLIETPSLRRQLGDAGRKTVEERYSVEAWSATYLNLLKNVVEKRSY